MQISDVMYLRPRYHNIPLGVPNLGPSKHVAFVPYLAHQVIIVGPSAP